MKASFNPVSGICPRKYVDFLQRKKKDQSDSNQSNPNKKSNISFGNGLGSIAYNGLSALEGSDVLQLVFTDFCGMIMPRTIIDTTRNKEELGGYNWNAGRETFLREIFSTGLMFFGAGTAAWLLSKLYMTNKVNPEGLNIMSSMSFEGNEMNVKSMDIFDSHVQELVKNYKGETFDLLELRKQYVNRILDNVINPHTGKKLFTDYAADTGKQAEVQQLRSEMVDFVTKNTKNADIGAMLAEEQITNGILPQRAIKDRIKDAISENRHRNRDMAKSLEYRITELNGFRGDVTLQSAEGKNLKKAYSIDAFLRNMLDFDNDILLRAPYYLKEEAAAAAEQAKNPKIINNVTKEVFTNRYNAAFERLMTLKVAKRMPAYFIAMGGLISFPLVNMWISKKVSGGCEFPGLKGLIQDNNYKIHTVKPTKPAVNQNKNSIIFQKKGGTSK